MARAQPWCGCLLPACAVEPVACGALPRIKLARRILAAQAECVLVRLALAQVLVHAGAEARAERRELGALPRLQQRAKVLLLDQTMPLPAGHGVAVKDKGARSGKRTV